MNDTEFMSVFDGVDFSVLDCTRAEKNIADDYDRKYITTRLGFQDHTGNPVFAVRSSYSIDNDLKVMLEDAIKISSDNFKRNSNMRLRTFGEHSVTESIKKDLDLIERLFQNASDEIKRVY